MNVIELETMIKKFNSIRISVRLKGGAGWILSCDNEELTA